jgi:chromosome partitioning protein
MIVSFANLKGGTGKTTIVVHLGAALAAAGSRVLLIDLAPQGDATFHLDVHSAKPRFDMSDVLFRGQKLENVILETAVPGLFAAPSGSDLVNVDLELASRKGRESTLLGSLTDPLRRDFDYVLLDTPSTLNLLLVNALVASDGLIIPTVPTFLSVRGLREVLRTQEILKRNMNCGVSFFGVLLTMVDYRVQSAEEIVGNLRSSFGRKVFNTTIGRDDALAECPAAHRTVLQMRPGSPAARSFFRLREEFLQKVRLEERPGPGADESVEGAIPGLREDDARV